MTSTLTSVIIASASAVAKVFLIGAVGYFSVLFPKKAPLLPRKIVATLARLNFNLFLIPLVYATIAQSVSVDAIGSLWFILVSAWGVIFISYVTCTLLGYLPFFRVESDADFDALRIAASFPNIVALPILIFPALCEYKIVHESFSDFGNDGDADPPTEAEMYRDCVAKSNSMVFLYFFAWSLIFWSFGHQKLVKVGKLRQTQTNEKKNTAVHSVTTIISTSPNNNTPSSNDAEEEETEGQQQSSTTVNNEESTSFLHSFWKALKETFKSPPFIAMVLGFITGCISPLREAMFSPGGSLRFLGGAFEALGTCAQVVGTIVVAAAIVPKPKEKTNDDSSTDDNKIRSNTNNDHEDNENRMTSLEANEKLSESLSDLNLVVANGDSDASRSTKHRRFHDDDVAKEQSRGVESPIMSDPTFGPHRPGLDRRQSLRSSSLVWYGQEFSHRSNLALTHIKQSPHLKAHSWFICSRLIVSPAVVCAILMGLDCGGFMKDVPDLTKLVVLLNSSLPGALTIVVILKSNNLAESAATVAGVYLPSYLLSIITVAAWTSVGLWISIPSEDGSSSFCSR